MKFLVTWQLHEGKLHEALAMFGHMTDEQEEAAMGDGVKLLHRWHDLVRGSGAAIFEADNAAALSAYSLGWSQFMDLDLSMVVEDDEAKAIGRSLEFDDE